MEERIEDTTKTDDAHQRTLAIGLTVSLSLAVLIAILIIAVIVHRRRYTTIRLKKLQNSNRLKQIVVSLSPAAIRLKYHRSISYPFFFYLFQRYLKKRLYFSHPQPRTETIVYNYVGISNTSFTSDVLNLSTLTEQSLPRNSFFPVSLQAPVPSISSIYLEVIANHRLSSIESTENLSTSISNTDTSRISGTSFSSNSSQKVLLFSQRSEV